MAKRNQGNQGNRGGNGRNRGNSLSQEDRRKGGEKSAEMQTRDAQGQFAGRESGSTGGGRSSGGGASSRGGSSGGNR